jgi:hypothetical protein
MLFTGLWIRGEGRSASCVIALTEFVYASLSILAICPKKRMDEASLDVRGMGLREWVKRSGLFAQPLVQRLKQLLQSPDDGGVQIRRDISEDILMDLHVTGFKLL